MTLTLPVDAVQFVKELYPRLREDDAAIERYRAALDRLPPIIVARGRILVDGFHRWQAHQREGRTEVAAIDLGNLADAEILRESITRNAAHGQQLSARDKERLAGQLWQTFGHLDNGDRVGEIANLLSVDASSVRRWTKDARAQEKAEQKARAWDMWLECHSERAIAERLGVTQPTVGDWVKENKQLPIFYQPPTSRQHFDVWNFHKADGESSYFGRMPPQIVENLLWLYTAPGQIVVDPFAGGGTTIDVARRMGRRVWASDRKPATPTLPIHKHDIVTGWPEQAPNRADFILLDPPYWKQAAGKYSDDPEDLGNKKTLNAFADAWLAVVLNCTKHLAQGGTFAFIVSPAEDKEQDRVVDLAFLMYQACIDAGLVPKRRIIATYNTQQATGQQVEWARGHRKLLKLYRDIVVFSR